MRYIFFISCLVFSSLSNAQVTGLTSLRTIHPYVDHVAFAGLQPAVDARAGFRSQWNEVTGNPISQFATVNFPILGTGIGAGLRLHNETLGAYGQTRMTASTNYILNTGTALISGGIGLSLIQSRLDGLRLITPEGSYEGVVINHNDAILLEGPASASAFAAEISFFLRTAQLELGISAHNINRPQLALGVGESVIAQFERSIHGMVRYRFRPVDDWIVVPAVMVHWTQAQHQTLAFTEAVYRDGFSVGAGIRGYNGDHLDAVLLTAGTRLGDRFWVRYAYDIGLSGLARAGQGSHEILLSYRVGLRPKSGNVPRIIYNPRYFD